MKYRTALSCILPILLISMFSFADIIQNITIEDNDNPAGVRYYCYHTIDDTPYSEMDRVDLGTNTTYAWTLTDPVQLGVHKWMCTAYYNALESTPSNELTWVNAPAPVTITGEILSVSNKSAVLYAESSVPTTTLLLYGRQRGQSTFVYDQSAIVNTSFKTEHQIELTKLKKDTEYKYRWVGLAQSGQTYMFEGTFKTTS